MATTDTWPRQLTLPGQVAAPEGPIDMSIRYVMHHAFRRDLDLLCAAARNTPVGERRTWRLLAERWELFAEALHEHHTVEDDAIWPRLAAVGDPAERATLEAMEEEHTEIDPLLVSCAAGFRRLGDRADEDARAALTVRVVALRASLRRHLAHEETDAIAIIQRHLSPEDWARLKQDGKRPALGRVARIVPWAAYGVPREGLDRVFAGEGGAGLRLLWRLTRRGFGRRHARTFRFA